MGLLMDIAQLGFLHLRERSTLASRQCMRHTSSVKKVFQQAWRRRGTVGELPPAFCMFWKLCFEGNLPCTLHDIMVVG